MSHVEDLTPAHTDHIGATSFSVFSALAGHEQVVFCHDIRTNLRAIIAIHSTALGPALGGTRFFDYPREQDAVQDVLFRLWLELRSGTVVENPRAWAYRAIYRIAMDHHRLRARIASLAKRLERGRDEPTHDTADRVAVWNEITGATAMAAG